MQYGQLLAARTVFFLLDRAPRRHVGMLAEAMMTRYARPQNGGLDVIGTALKHSSNVAATINDLVLSTSPADVISSVARLIKLRDAVMNKIFLAAPDVDNVPVREWLTLASENQTGLVVRDQIEHRIKNFALFDGSNRRRFEVLTLHVLIKAERDDLLSEFFEASEFYSWKTIPSVYKTGILRSTIRRDPANYARFRELVARRHSQFDRLKYLELDIAAGYVTDVPLHNEITKQFMYAVPAGVTQDFELLVKPFYDAHDQSLMDARTNKKTQQTLADAIDSHVRLAKPLSLTRVGDGESYAYAGYSEYVTDADVKMRENHWWGHELDQSLRNRIQSQVREAIEQADYVGVPSIYRFIRDTDESSRDMTSTAGQRGLVAAMSSMKLKNGAKIIEDRIHQVMFSLARIKTLARKGVRLHIISSVKPEVVQGFGLIANTIAIPTHHKTRTNDIFQAAAKPLPFVYEGTIDEIKSSVEPGDLVLVSAGVIGKIFVHEASKCGAIALDVGSMVDYWAGAKTRSVADLV